MKKKYQISRYEDLGVRSLINCVGTVTVLSGSLILPQVRQAMTDASMQYVAIRELMECAGARLAEVMQCEWGLVTNGCAAALAQVTSACITGNDPALIARLPDTNGLKNEVIVQTSHRVGYDRAITAVGTRFIEVTTHAELEAAYSDRTAMLFIFGDAAERGQISVAEMATSGRAHGVPVFVDAAAERPDVPNWYFDQGVDAVAYSGGKCLRGPQASGLVLGRKQLLQDAFANGSPHGSFGRPMKVGKEEIRGLLAAVEMWVQRDHKGEWKEWERRLETISTAVQTFATVTTEVNLPGRSNVAPNLSIRWDAEQLGITATQVCRQLSQGEPRVEASGGANGISINPYMMEEGEDTLVAERLAEILAAA